MLFEMSSVWMLGSQAAVNVAIYREKLDKQIFSNMISKYRNFSSYNHYCTSRFLHGHILFHLNKPDPVEMKTTSNQKYPNIRPCCQGRSQTFSFGRATGGARQNFGGQWPPWHPPSFAPACCNLSGGVALIVWFTTNGMCAKNKNIYAWREQAIIIEIATHDLYCCVHAARDFRSQQNGAVTRIWRSCRVQPSHKQRAIGAVHCKKDVVTTSPVVLCWMCDSSRTGCARKTIIYIRGLNKQ